MDAEIGHCVRFCKEEKGLEGNSQRNNTNVTVYSAEVNVLFFLLVPC